MAKDRKQGFAVLGAMGGLFLIGALLVMPLEAHGNVHITQANVSQAITSTIAGRQHGGQGGPQRAHHLGPLQLLIDEHLHRLDQLGQRQLHPLVGGCSSST